ncbi:ABC transporter substrate-binding protein [uncultured Devosia sp.]|uniref:ABC transporter substrate-binding protein n=1 Tax=uncultured Devosia sp. TaxID=211434 RepID=UPI0035CAB4E8
MNKLVRLAGGASLWLGVCAGAVQAQIVEPTVPPDPPVFAAQGTPQFVGVADMLEYKALPEYHQPAWMDKFVADGKLPPVAERLPKEPLVFKTANMPDGIGVYGDVMRHVIGGRPEGWNYIGGQAQGWGGIDIGMSECLTRTGPLFQIKAEELQPLPNLAKSWEWSEDGHELTMHLIEGAKWSDGDPFDAEDVMFYWEDNVLDSNVTPTNGATPETFGTGTTLVALDPYTIKWTFKSVRPEQYLYQMAYGTFCPGPSHLLKPQHPKYNTANTYDQYKNAFPPEYMNMPVMGAWVPMEYRADDVIVMRRNPYYWKVDENGNQLPYLNEVQYLLSTWAARDIMAASGTGDYSNLEQPENYVEALKRASQPDAPARLEFGPRTIGYSLLFNLSGNGWGQPDPRAQAVRELNRNLDFRKAISSALDRQRLGEGLSRGPFTAIYPGGIYSASAFYDKASTVYFPFSIETAKAYLAKAGLVDTDGNGFVNFPAGMMNGEDVTITLLTNTEIVTNRNVAEAVIAGLEPIGIRVVANFMSSTQSDANTQSGQFDWLVYRNLSDLVTVVQNTTTLAPVGPRTSVFHRAGSDGTLDLLPFEQDMIDVVDAFTATNDRAERVELMKHYQRLYTENVYAAGLTQYSAALVVNKRFANIPVGAPNFMFNWGEDSVMRERVFVPAASQQSYELFPNALPGAPGSPGPID